MRDKHKMYKLYDNFKGHDIILWLKIVCYGIQTQLVKVRNKHLHACKIELTKKRVEQFHQNVSLQPGAFQVEASCKPNYDCHAKQHCLFPFSIELNDMLCLGKRFHF